MQELILYYFPMCPFCAKVLQFLKENNIVIDTKNISNNKKFYKELIHKTGHQRVPVLFINNKHIYESNDIIIWLKKNL